MASSSSFERPVFTSASTPRSLKMASAAGESLSAIRTRGIRLLRGFSLEERFGGGKWFGQPRIGMGAVVRHHVEDHVGHDGAGEFGDFARELAPIALRLDDDQRMRRFVAIAEGDLE